jgi:hypothetical protein
MPSQININLDNTDNNLILMVKLEDSLDNLDNMDNQECPNSLDTKANQVNLDIQANNNRDNLLEEVSDNNLDFNYGFFDPNQKK